jgi:hypothetical protein
VQQIVDILRVGKAGLKTVQSDEVEVISVPFSCAKDAG